MSLTQTLQKAAVNLIHLCMRDAYTLKTVSKCILKQVISCICCGHVLSSVGIRAY